MKYFPVNSIKIILSLSQNDSRQVVFNREFLLILNLIREDSRNSWFIFDF